jgi:hypothetical protein
MDALRPSPPPRNEARGVGESGRAGPGPGRGVRVSPKPTLRTRPIVTSRRAQRRANFSQHRYSFNHIAHTLLLALLHRAPYNSSSRPSDGAVMSQGQTNATSVRASAAEALSAGGSPAKKPRLRLDPTTRAGAGPEGSAAAEMPGDPASSTGIGESVGGLVPRSAGEEGGSSGERSAAG